MGNEDGYLNLSSSHDMIFGVVIGESYDDDCGGIFVGCGFGCGVGP